ncbi:hypothetical protein SELMODRAFT_410292 [Selaginella moellendorffii]|uniref:Uncharacterized protein n=1 Tax=Selaginella moellendorffii TaxID=88036 RepID=D8REA4_SELML|nr:hypothetical protein SELMODRAFT_410292 [Selaginella moellendorffii]
MKQNLSSGTSGVLKFLAHLRVSWSTYDLDNIYRFGHHYVLWCYRFERMSSFLNKFHTNSKEMEVTFSRMINRVTFLKLMRLRYLEKDGVSARSRMEDLLTEAAGYNGGRGSSTEIVNEQWRMYWTLLALNGILIGRALQSGQEVTEYPQLLVDGVIYRKGDNIVVDNPEREVDWVGCFYDAFAGKTSFGGEERGSGDVDVKVSLVSSRQGYTVAAAPVSVFPVVDNVVQMELTGEVGGK